MLFRSGARLKHDSSLLNQSVYEIIAYDKIVENVSEAKNAALFFKDARVNAIIIRLSTWCDDNLLLELVNHHDVPILNWAMRDVNAGSLCGGQQFNMVLKELKKPSTFILGIGGESVEQIDREVKVFSAFQQREEKNSTFFTKLNNIIDDFSRLKIGIIGTRTQGMMEVAYSEFDLKEIFGVSVISYSLDFIKQESGNVSKLEVKNVKNLILETNSNLVIDCSEEALENSVRVYIVLKRLANEYNLGGFTVECYPRFMGEACLAFSLLSHDGFACACEGDVHSTIIMWLVQKLSGQPANHLDLLDVDIENNEIFGGHCGSCAIDLAPPDEKIHLTPVRLADTGLCLPFVAKPGRVILCNFVGRKGTYRTLVCKGTVIPSEMDFPGCVMRIKLDIGVKKLLKIVNEAGLGHHWVVGYNIEWFDDFVSILDFFKVQVVE